MRFPSVLGIISYPVFPAHMGGQKGIAGFYTHLSGFTKVVLAVSVNNEAASTASLQVIPFLYHHRRGWANIRYLFRLYKLIKQEQTDIICIEHSYLGWLGILLKWLTQKKLVIHSHNIETLRFRDMQKPGWRIYQWYERWVHRQAGHSFFVTADEMQWAITHWRLNPAKCSVVTYGIECIGPISREEKNEHRNLLISQYNLHPSVALFFFNGSFDYLPNTDALRVILHEIVPVLRSERQNFRILICGRWMPASWQQVLANCPEIIYCGFAEDVSLYYKGADCFINPVTLGSGIKIKLIDALAMNLKVISARNGARGVNTALAGQNLLIVDDYDWQGFAHAMISSISTEQVDTPPSFYESFNWDSIVHRALLSLQSL